MSEDDPTGGSGPPAKIARVLSPTVVRSAVVEGRPYNDYKLQLRHDFFYSCAYCTVTEAEAQAVRMLIDHYEPVSMRPELANSYANLMYACEECNLRKGSTCPPPEARAAGKRFFRIDEEPRSEHFRLEGNELVGVTEVGSFTILACDLNRESLVRMRAIRRKLYDSEGFAGEGILALASFQMDSLPPAVRLRAERAINKILETAKEVFDSFDELLIEFAKSAIIIDEASEEEKQRNKERLAKLKALEGTFPATWRGRKPRGKKRH